MDAKTYLEEVKQKQDFWELKKLELLKLKALETNTAANLNNEPIQSSGTKDRLGLEIAKRIDYETEVVEKAKNEFLKCRNECIQTLECVKEKSFIQYKVLHLVYIDYYRLNKLDKKMGYSYQYIKELHIKGLNTVQDIIDKSGKE